MKLSMKIGTSFRAFLAAALAVVTAACGDARATDAARQDDLERDLELASATTMNLASARVDPSLLDALETKPQGAPLAVPTIRKGAGSRAVRSSTPTVRATPEVELAAEATDATLISAEAPAPEVSEPVAVVPRPAPVPAEPAGDYGTGGGGVIFGGGGIGGVIIRGGGVDGDNCDLHTRGGRRGTTRGPIYMPTVPVATQPSGPSGTAGRPRGGFGGFGGTEGPATDARRPTGPQPARPAGPRSGPVSRRGF